MVLGVYEVLLALVINSNNSRATRGVHTPPRHVAIGHQQVRQLKPFMLTLKFHGSYLL